MFLDFENYKKQSFKSKILTNYLVCSSDLDTPVSVYAKLQRESKDAFIFESVIGGEKIGRYSFVGYKALKKISIPGNSKENCYKVLESNLIELNQGQDLKEDELLPFFYKGFVGFFSFESVAQIETSLNLKKSTMPEMYQLLVGSLVVFDHLAKKMYLIDNSIKENNDSLEKLYENSCEEIDKLKKLIESPLQESRFDFKQTKPDLNTIETQSNTGKERFMELVQKAKEHIIEGDIFQVVLSHKFYLNQKTNPLQAYRMLRTVNPSPYLFLFNFSCEDKQFSLVGSSPEMLCKASINHSLNGIEAEIRPIAGTYKRGANLEEDTLLAEKLINDPKERAEHVMLIDLARNDLGRICRQGTISVPQNMIVEKYSHVLHIVSSVKGLVQKSLAVLSGLELVKACFPAGTLSGAPKVESLKIISQLELEPRAIYGGTIGYFGLDGTVDTAIMIRTMLIEDNKITIQAGAGIVADSEPEKEWQETINKASALFSTLVQMI